MCATTTPRVSDRSRQQSSITAKRLRRETASQ
jgi:hypothetical protein